MDQERAKFPKWMVLLLSCAASGVHFGPSVKLMMVRAVCVSAG